MSENDLVIELLSGYRPRVKDATKKLISQLELNVEVTLAVHLFYLMTSDILDVKTRVAAGNMLAELGDPRFNPRFYYLPKDDLLGFVKIDSGPFIMGSKRENYSGPLLPISPQRKIILPDYYIGRYHVTVAQYRAFINGTGMKMDWDVGLDRLSNHPITWLTWFEAYSYCEWLNQKLMSWDGTPSQIRFLLENGWKCTLPNEAEWEKAARGNTGWVYPWGNEFDKNKANVDVTGLGQLATRNDDGTSPVGVFPLGKSPYNIFDMSGNVWDWTRSIAREKKPFDGVDTLSDRKSKRVLRGGTYYNSAKTATTSYRFGFPPEGNDNAFGFRVAIVKTLN